MLRNSLETKYSNGDNADLQIPQKYVLVFLIKNFLKFPSAFNIII